MKHKYSSLVINTWECSVCKERKQRNTAQQNEGQPIYCLRCWDEKKERNLCYVIFREQPCATCDKRMRTDDYMSIHTGRLFDGWYQVSYACAIGSIGNFPPPDPTKEQNFYFCSKECRNKYLADMMEED